MTQVQGSNLLDVLKKKMRQTKEEMEKYKEESEDMARKLQVEICRREEVSVTLSKTKFSINLYRQQIYLAWFVQVPNNLQKYLNNQRLATNGQR